MSFRALRSTDFIDILQSYWSGVMEAQATARKPNLIMRQQSVNIRKPFPTNYFSVESFLVLLCLTVSLLILPLILPPLPPPPTLLLLLPIGLLAVLVVLAFMPSDVRNIASSYL